MQFSSKNLYKFGFSALSSGSLVALFLGLGSSHAAAQITIQSTGTISGTLQFPFGTTTNGRVTRIDTDKNGTYFRNIGTRSNPNLIPVYSSKFVQIQTNPDGSIKSFVDFLGLQFISPDGLITSPVLSGGKLQPYKYQGRPDPRFLVNFQAAVQDELALQRAFYEGIVTDPKTGQQYQGVFEVNGQGPRYSDRNGGDSPTVFDFKTDYDPLSGVRPTPALNSYKMTNVPLVRLTILVPSGMQPINPNNGTPATTPTGTAGSTPATTPSGTAGGTTGGTTGGGTTTSISTPIDTIISGATSGISTSSGGTPSGTGTAPIGTTSSTASDTPSGMASTGNTAAISTSDVAPISNATPNTNTFTSISTPTTGINSTVSPSIQPNVEFSSGSISGSSTAVNSNSAALVSARNKSTQVGPRSRVLVR